MHVLPEAHTAHPVQPVPPHWAYFPAAHVELADAEEAVLAVVLLPDAEVVVDTVEVASVVALWLDEATDVLDATTDEDEEEPLLDESLRWREGKRKNSILKIKIL